RLPLRADWRNDQRMADHAEQVSTSGLGNLCKVSCSGRGITVSIPPELLAALAQVESAGNPVATTYWRWRLSSDPFAVYHPASSAVGMYQMTDAAFAEAQGYCILHHTVTETGCSPTALYSRVVPRHATELTAVLLHRDVTANLGHGRRMNNIREEGEEQAGDIHLCGSGPATPCGGRGFLCLP